MSTKTAAPLGPQTEAEQRGRATAQRGIPPAPPLTLDARAQWVADHVSIATLEALPDDGWQYELVEGRLLRMPPPGADHGDVLGRLALPLATYVRDHSLGTTYWGETGWDLTRSGEARTRETLLASDAAFVRWERLPLPPPRTGRSYRPIAPDLVVEIASPSQRSPRSLRAKARRWCARGMRLVWVIWPESMAVEVYRPDAPPTTLSEDATLSGEDVVPGFELPLRALWPSTPQV